MRWIWIDRIAQLEKAKSCIAVKNVSMAEEHLHDHFAETDDHPAIPVMPASLVIEGMAQTAGILVGHARDFREKVILAKITKAVFHCSVFPGQTIFHVATLERIDDSGASATGKVHVIDHTQSHAAPTSAEKLHVADIELMFSHIDQNMSGLEFPDHNFVFTDQFMDLLRNSGFA